MISARSPIYLSASSYLYKKNPRRRKKYFSKIVEVSLKIRFCSVGEKRITMLFVKCKILGHSRDVLLVEV